MEPRNENVALSSVFKIGEPENYIIAIGASAGGMQAIHTLFDNTPSDGVSYVIIQHLSPDHKSFMAELLAKHSKLKIFEAEDGMEVLCNKIYVMPKGKVMRIAGGKLFLNDREKSTPNSAIDTFFNALAEDQGNQSIAIILAGNGSDGSKGIAAIKKAGGMVIVQEPDSTENKSMPTSAIESGYYDFILPPDLIPEQIIKYVKQRELTSNFTGHIPEKDELALLDVIELIKANTPLDFSEYKRPTIVRRVVRRMLACNANTINDYIEILKNNPTEINILSKEFLISVTQFFRDALAFEIIKSWVIPQIIENKLLVDNIKVWVIGCATGEEAYSLAILIKEYLIDIKKDIEVKIFATDIDKDALGIASKGIYSGNIIKEVSEARLSKFFYKEGDKYRVKESLRNMLIFAQHDITRNPPYNKLDLITCRNLLIYLNPVLQKKVLSMLHYCLNPGGYLFLGPSESIGDIKNNFSELDNKWKIYKNLQPPGTLVNGIYTAPSFYVKPQLKGSPVLKSLNTEATDNLHEFVVKTLSQKLNSAGVCVDENYKIIKTFGDYQSFLIPTMFNFNLLEVLPPELSIVTATGLNQIAREKKELTIKEVVFMQNDAPRSVTIYFKPSYENKFLQDVTLVCFTDHTQLHPIENSEIFNKELHSTRYLLDVEENLKDTQKKLKESDEALENMNAYAQAYSEELISGNEELQSTNEEVQSVNEELHTVNNQYQLKIKELGESNDDLNNYFRSTVNGHIYVDRDFIIRKFTPSAVKQVNLKETDIGRALSDISTNIKFSNMMEDLRTVVSSSKMIEKEIETLNNQWYQMTLHPYVRQHDNQTDGVIISFNEITDLKIAQKKLIKINEDHHTFIYSVSHDLKAPIANIEGLISSLDASIESDLEEVKETVELINFSVIKLKDIIAELSDISRIEMESAKEIKEPINFRILFNEIEFSIKEIVLRSKAKITVDFQENEIRFSKKNLRSIILNLLTNAIKYKSPERDPEITIRTEKFGNFIVLSITDNGMGISKQDKGTIFTMFKRVDNDSNIEGSGIGLYLINKIISNAEGKITVESELGKGSTFEVWLRI